MILFDFTFRLVMPVVAFSRASNAARHSSACERVAQMASSSSSYAARITPPSFVTCGGESTNAFLRCSSTPSGSASCEPMVDSSGASQFASTSRSIGIRSRVSRMAPRSFGLATFNSTRAARRSRSESPLRVEAMTEACEARSLTASCRATISDRESRGARTHERRSLAPPGVAV